jgi:hypothetical protein
VVVIHFPQKARSLLRFTPSHLALLILSEGSFPIHPENPFLFYVFLNPRQGGTVMEKHLRVILLTFLAIVVFSGLAFGWSCKVHKFIASEAGLLGDIDSVCCPDTCNEENKDAISPFHYYNAAPDTEVSPEYLDRTVEILFIILYPYLPEPEQITIKVPNKSGALYWGILELYKDMKEKKEKGEKVYFSTIDHFIGDLSQPLHNFPHGNELASDGKYYRREGKWAIEESGKDKYGYDKDRHGDFDHAFDEYIDESLHIKDNPTDCSKAFAARITPISVESLNDLKLEISRIANSSIRIANRCYKENDKMTPDELYKQIGMSVSLLKAIKANIDSIKKKQ